MFPSDEAELILKAQPDLPFREKELSELLAGIIERDPKYFLFFGPYWWHIKEMLVRNLDNDKWYQGGYEDTHVKEICFYRDTHSTLKLAFIYVKHQQWKTDAHEIFVGEGENEESRPYSLYDADSGIEGSL